MAEYLIIKREVCPGCGGSNKQFVCRECRGFGYRGTQVSLLDALNDARITEILCDCTHTHFGKVVGDDWQGLEWTCPKTGELKRDVNA